MVGTSTQGMVGVGAGHSPEAGEGMACSVPTKAEPQKVSQKLLFLLRKLRNYFPNVKLALNDLNLWVLFK